MTQKNQTPSCYSRLLIAPYGTEPTPDTVLDIQSTDGAFKLPCMTQKQREALKAKAGMMVFDTDANSVVVSGKDSGWTPSGSVDIKGAPGEIVVTTEDATKAKIVGLADTKVTAGDYISPNISVDAKGRITSAKSGTPGETVEITAGEGLEATPANPILAKGTIKLKEVGITPKRYSAPIINVDAYGRITTAVDGIAPGPGIDAKVVPETGMTVIGLERSGVVPSPGTDPKQVTNAKITIDIFGRITQAEDGPGGISTITEGVGITATTTAGNTTVALKDMPGRPNTPTPYTNANITVDKQGRITAASSGTAVEEIVQGVGILVTDSTPTPGSPTVSLKNTSVIPNRYGASMMTVDQQGRITLATDGIEGGAYIVNGVVPTTVGGMGVRLYSNENKLKVLTASADQSTSGTVMIANKTAMNSTVGTVNLVRGRATVSTNAAYPTSIILTSVKVATGVTGTSINSLTADCTTAGSFTITSGTTLDTSTVNWLIVNP